jgi:peroxiredoxin
MKAFLHVLAILATVGVWVADLLLLSVPAVPQRVVDADVLRVPRGAAGARVGRRGQEGVRGRRVAVFLVGLGGWIGLRFSGKIPDNPPPAVAVGERAPDFMLKDQDGKDLRLSDLTDQGRVVLIFFRGKYCLACRGALRGLVPKYKDFVDSKVAVVAVGPVTPEEAKAFELPFPVLSDLQFEATKKYGPLPREGVAGQGRAAAHDAPARQEPRHQMDARIERRAHPPRSRGNLRGAEEVASGSCSISSTSASTSPTGSSGATARP